jgi:hypothetical protein
MVESKKNGKAKGKLYQPGAERSGMKTGIVFLLQRFGRLDVEFLHDLPPVIQTNDFALRTSDNWRSGTGHDFGPFPPPRQVMTI